MNNKINNKVYNKTQNKIHYKIHYKIHNKIILFYLRRNRFLNNQIYSFLKIKKLKSNNELIKNKYRNNCIKVYKKLIKIKFHMNNNVLINKIIIKVISKNLIN